MTVSIEDRQIKGLTVKVAVVAALFIISGIGSAFGLYYGIKSEFQVIKSEIQADRKDRDKDKAVTEIQIETIKLQVEKLELDFKEFKEKAGK